MHISLLHIQDPLAVTKSEYEALWHAGVQACRVWLAASAGAAHCDFRFHLDLSNRYILLVEPGTSGWDLLNDITRSIIGCYLMLPRRPNVSNIRVPTFHLTPFSVRGRCTCIAIIANWFAILIRCPVAVESAATNTYLSYKRQGRL